MCRHRVISHDEESWCMCDVGEGYKKHGQCINNVLSSLECTIIYPQLLAMASFWLTIEHQTVYRHSWDLSTMRGFAYYRFCEHL